MSLEEFAESIAPESRVLLAASTGGHFSQLERISARLGPGLRRRWLTFDHPQSRSALSSQEVTYIPYIGSRDFAGLFRAARPTLKALRLTPADVYISTGAAVALLVLPFAALRGRRAIYIESVSRFDGPSATGKLLSLFYPKIELYTQHASWSNRKWRYKFTLLSEYEVSRRTAVPVISRVFVTLGTIRPFGFSSLVARLQEVLPGGVDVVWQLGETKAPAGLTGRVTDYLDATEMRKAVDWADVVVSHSGVGSALWLLDLGKTPVLVPRRAYRGEHIDDHQMQIGRELAHRGLAITRDAQELEYADLLEAAASVVRASGHREPQE